LARSFLGGVILVGAGAAAFGVQLLSRSGRAELSQPIADTQPASIAEPGLVEQGSSTTPPEQSPLLAAAEPVPLGEELGPVAPKTDALANVSVAAPALPFGAQRRSTTFGKAASFKDALEKSAGLTRDEATELIDALAGTLDFRRSQPTDAITVERDLEGKLTRFEYRSGLLQRYEAVRTPAGKLAAKQVDIPIRTVRIERGGILAGSLGDALEGLSLGRTLAGVFSEVFEGKVNFSADARNGDTFRIIVDEEYVEGTFLRYGNVLALEYRGAKTGVHQAFWHDPEDGDGDFYDASGRALHGGWLRTPLRYDHVSSGFGMRFHPVLKRKKLHNGIDYAAGTGTPVRAAATGTVTFAGPKGANGNLIVISHFSGYESFYAHLSRFAPGIKKGTKVTQRQLIAYVGSTGRSTGPHLHFSLKRQGRFIDPSAQLNGPGLPMAQAELPEYRRRARQLAAALSRIQAEQPKPVASQDDAPVPLDSGDEEL
jgi:murein DD-endopeptidase MepM/ murein hydrolase activator NlpD